MPFIGAEPTPTNGPMSYPSDTEVGSAVTPKKLFRTNSMGRHQTLTAYNSRSKAGSTLLVPSPSISTQAGNNAPAPTPNSPGPLSASSSPLASLSPASSTDTLDTATSSETSATSSLSPLRRRARASPASAHAFSSAAPFTCDSAAPAEPAVRQRTSRTQSVNSPAQAFKSPQVAAVNSAQASSDADTRRPRAGPITNRPTVFEVHILSNVDPRGKHLGKPTTSAQRETSPGLQRLGTLNSMNSTVKQADWRPTSAGTGAMPRAMGARTASMTAGTQADAIRNASRPGTAGPSGRSALQDGADGKRAQFRRVATGKGTSLAPFDTGAAPTSHQGGLSRSTTTNAHTQAPSGAQMSHADMELRRPRRVMSTAAAPKEATEKPRSPSAPVSMRRAEAARTAASVKPGAWTFRGPPQESSKASKFPSRLPVAASSGKALGEAPEGVGPQTESDKERKRSLSVPRFGTSSTTATAAPTGGAGKEPLPAARTLAEGVQLTGLGSKSLAAGEQELEGGAAPGAVLEKGASSDDPKEPDASGKWRRFLPVMRPRTAGPAKQAPSRPKSGGIFQAGAGRLRKPRTHRKDGSKSGAKDATKDAAAAGAGVPPQPEVAASEVGAGEEELPRPGTAAGRVGGKAGGALKSLLSSRGEWGQKIRNNLTWAQGKFVPATATTEGTVAQGDTAEKAPEVGESTGGSIPEEGEQVLTPGYEDSEGQKVGEEVSSQDTTTTAEVAVVSSGEVSTPPPADATSATSSQERPAPPSGVWDPQSPSAAEDLVEAMKLLLAATRPATMSADDSDAECDRGDEAGELRDTSKQLRVASDLLLKASQKLEAQKLGN